MVQNKEKINTIVAVANEGMHRKAKKINDIPVTSYILRRAVF